MYASAYPHNIICHNSLHAVSVVRLHLKRAGVLGNSLLVCSLMGLTGQL